jgi:hypothetical protein
MTQEEEKQLLIKDLCARLLYGLRVKIFDESILSYGNNEEGTLDGKETMSDDCFVIKCSNDSWIISYKDFKPYLRPMSSMTKEERSEYFDFRNQELQRVAFAEIGRESAIAEISDWLNANHFDYRGLIERGLALEAPDGMYKTE